MKRSLEYDVIITMRKYNLEPRGIFFDGQIAWGI